VARGNAIASAARSQIHTVRLSNMDAHAASSNLNGTQPSLSPETHTKLSQHSPTVDDEHDGWSAAEGSSGEEVNRSQNGAAKRRRPLSVSCETCKQRKVKCDRGQPSCGWCMKNHSQCIYLPRKKPGLRAGYGRELEARLGKYTLPQRSAKRAAS
jgi:hypothetical protein